MCSKRLPGLAGMESEKNAPPKLAEGPSRLQLLPMTRNAPIEVTIGYIQRAGMSFAESELPARLPRTLSRVAPFHSGLPLTGT